MGNYGARIVDYDPKESQQILDQVAYTVAQHADEFVNGFNVMVTTLDDHWTVSLAPLGVPND